MKIYKYTLSIVDEQTITMPAGARPLSVHEQHGNLCVWAIVNESATETRSVRFWIRGTGHPAEGLSFASFLGTVVTRGEALVWHIFYDALSC